MSTQAENSDESDGNQDIRTSLMEIGKEHICAFLAGYVLGQLPIQSLLLI